MSEKERDTFVRGLEIAMQRTNWKAAPLSEAAGMGITAVRDLFRKNSSPKVSTAQAIAETIGMTVDDIIMLGRDSNHPTLLTPQIMVAGRVGAGAKVPLFDHTEDGGLFHVAAPAQILRQGPPCNVSAVEVEGDSMSPMYQSGDILFFTRHTHDGIPDEDIGRPCVVEDANGMAWVKQVKRGDAPGLFHLISLNPTSETMHNVPIKWAARVKLALPAEMVERI